MDTDKLQDQGERRLADARELDWSGPRVGGGRGHIPGGRHRVGIEQGEREWAGAISFLPPNTFPSAGKVPRLLHSPHAYTL